MRLWEEVVSAQKRIQNAILRTPLIYSDTFSALTGKEVFLKLENLQKGGSFKIRGAYNKLSQIDPAVRRRGVVAASAGNHAQGVAIASALLLRDIPGSLLRLTRLMAEHHANILHIVHERASPSDSRGSPWSWRPAVLTTSGRSRKG